MWIVCLPCYLLAVESCAVPHRSNNTQHTPNRGLTAGQMTAAALRKQDHPLADNMKTRSHESLSVRTKTAEAILLYSLHMTSSNSHHNITASTPKITEHKSHSTAPPREHTNQWGQPENCVFSHSCSHLLHLLDLVLDDRLHSCPRPPPCRHVLIC